MWGSRCRHHVRDEDARQGEVIPRYAWIIDVKVGWTFAETGAWHKAEGFERKEANEVFKIVAQTNEAIFYIGRRSKYFKEKLFVNKISEVLEMMIDRVTGTHPPNLVGHAHSVSSMKNPASKQRKTAF